MDTDDQPGSFDSLLLLLVIFLVVSLIGGVFFLRTRNSGRVLNKSSCVNGLRQIDGAKEQWALENKKTNGTPVTTADVLPYLKGGTLPLCPGQGAYTVGRVGELPRCSLAAQGHTI